MTRVAHQTAGVPLVELPLAPATQPNDTPIPPGARVRLTLHGVPIGVVSNDSDRDVPAADVFATFLASGASTSLSRCLARWSAASAADRNVLALLADGPDVSTALLPTTTIALCTRDRTPGLACALASIGALPEHVELLVVDNAPSTDATEALVATTFPFARYVRESVPGLNHARNRALREARGDVVAFIDDDVRVAPQWLPSVRRSFAANPDLTLLFGLVEPARLETAAERLFEAYLGFGRGFDRRWVMGPPGARSIAFPQANTGALGTGANMSIRRIHALALGGFDPALDAGTASAGGGDLAISFRVLKAGGLVAYEPAAYLEHFHRDTSDALASQISSWGTGMAWHLARSADVYEEERVALHALRLWLTGTWHTRRFVDSLVRDRLPTRLVARELSGLWSDTPSIEPRMSRPAPLHPPATGSPATLALELSEACAVLSTGGAAWADLTVSRNGRSLGVVRVPSIGGYVGATRARDAAADAFAPSILGQADVDVRRDVARWLGIAA